MDYESDMKRFSDHMNALAYAKEKGIAIGDVRGEARGVKKGVLQTAKSMLKDGLSPMRVARITKLPRKEILALR